MCILLQWIVRFIATLCALWSFLVCHFYNLFQFLPHFSLPAIFGLFLVCPFQLYGFHLAFHCFRKFRTSSCVSVSDVIQVASAYAKKCKVREHLIKAYLGICRCKYIPACGLRDHTTTYFDFTSSAHSASNSSPAVFLNDAGGFEGSDARPTLQTVHDSNSSSTRFSSVDELALYRSRMPANRQAALRLKSQLKARPLGHV